MAIAWPVPAVAQAARPAQEQMGLKLEATKAQVPVWMIDSAAKASAN